MLSASRGFLPYSSSFLEDFEGSNATDDDGDEKIGMVAPSSSSSKRQKRKHSTQKIVSSLDCTKIITSSSFKVVTLSDNGLLHVVATCAENAVLFFEGFARLTLLKGNVNIYGYDLEIGKTLTIKRSPWLPAAQVWCNDELIHSFQTTNGNAYLARKNSPVKLSTLSKQEKERLNALDLNGIKCCFIFEGFKADEQEWMVQIEDQGFDKSTLQNFTSHSSWVECEVLCCKTGRLGIQPFFSSINSDVMALSPTWISTVDTMVTDNALARMAGKMLPSFSDGSLSAAKLKKNDSKLCDTGLSPLPLISMVCGAKGAGKSSYMKYAVNRLLSYSRAIMGSDLAEVCIIDCDLGQPELSIPGVVSMNVISSPLVSSSHLHLQSPSSAIFLGDITSRYEPELFITALNKLREAYLDLQNSYNKRVFDKILSSSQEKYVKGDRVSCLGLNMFANLNDQDKSGRKFVTDAKSKKPIIMGESTDETWTIPLIINTDGNVQYMGAEILAAIKDIFRPSHIVHLASPKSKAQPIFDVLRRSAHSSSNPLCDSRSDGSCRFMSAERGREGASKLSPADLRNIRMVSYFLRNSAVSLPSIINSSVKKISEPLNLSERSLDTSPHNDTDFQDEEEERGTIRSTDGYRGKDFDGLYLKNAKFVGAEQCGALALAMLESDPFKGSVNHYIVPFDKVIFNSNRDEMVDENSMSNGNLLAAINGKVVGLSVLKEGLIENMSVVSKAMKYGGAHPKSQEFSVGENFCLRVFAHFQSLDCIGIVLVRAIHLSQQCLILTIPSMIKIPDGTIVLSTGVSLQLPNSFYCGFGFPTYPYLVSESRGEGSGNGKIRLSVKRKIGVECS